MKQWHHDHTSIPKDTLKPSKAGLAETSKVQVFSNLALACMAGTLFGQTACSLLFEALLWLVELNFHPLVTTISFVILWAQP